MRISRSFFMIVFAPFFSLAQCPVAQFDMAANACKQAGVGLSNTSTGAFSYYWNFCPSELANTSQTAVVAGPNDAYRSAFAFAIVRAPSPMLLSLRNNGVLNLVPLSDDLTTTVGPPAPVTGLTDAFSLPRALEIIKEGDNYYGLATNSGAGQALTLIDFGTSISPTASFVRLGSLGVNATNGLEIIKDDDGYTVFAGQNSGNTVYRLKYTGSISSTPTVASFTVTGATSINDIAIDVGCEGAVGLVSSLNNDKLIKLDFVNGLTNTPDVTQIAYTGESIEDPAKIALARDQGEYYAFIHTDAGKVYRLSFGETLVINPTSDLISSNGINGHDIKMFKENDRWVGFFIDYAVANRRVSRLTFENLCDVSPAFSTDEHPTPVFYTAGNYPLTLTVFDANGFSNTIRHSLNVLDRAAPIIDISVSGMCSGNNTVFAISADKELTSSLWDLGDGTFTSASSFSHAYSTAGEYNVLVAVADTDGCEATKEISHKIYSPPVAAFMLPSAPTCTNSSIAFENVLTDNFDGHLAYQWYVDNEPAGTERDLNYTFTTTGPKEIKLITSIPGCSNEEVKTIPAVFAGPLINFSSEGQCATEEISFTTEVSETVTDHFWSFDDGTFSTDVDPVHQFEFKGTYHVSLTATSPNGCNNSSTQEITIFSAPTPDFSIEPPPLACNGIATPFTDLTPDPPDSNVTSWLWQFDESAEIASTQNPEFTFTNAGDHDVSLTVITDAGCEGSVSKIVTIQPSPVAVITKTASCIGKPTTFTATGDDIQFYYWEIGTAYYENNEITHTFQTGGVHPLTLTVYGENNCVTTSNHSVNVPQSITPNFSFTNQCVGYETTFADITEDGHDPIASREWNFAGTPSGSSSPKHIFNGAGEHNVSLKVTTEAGCVYSASKKLTVLPAPIASFTASPEIGAAPLDVQFKNTSANATEWLWTFNDGTGNTSTDQSPAHTFTDIGEYRVELVARNTAGCESRFEKTFTVVTPLPDVNLKLISTSENPDGSIKVIITLENTGNTFIRNLPVEIDISGNTSLTETIKGPIPPGSLYNLVLSYSINSVNTLGFLCAEASLENDLEPSANRMCIQFEQSLFIFHPYPNPARDIVRFEWLSPAESEIIIQLADSFGKTHLFEKVGATVGLNRHQIDVAGLKPGVYFVILKEKGTIKTHRIVIAGQN